MKKYEATFISEGINGPIKITCVGERYSQALEQAERILGIEYFEEDVNPADATLISLLVIDPDYKPLCPKCGKPLIPSEEGNYELQCLDCDEDFYICEVRE